MPFRHTAPGWSGEQQTPSKKTMADRSAAACNTGGVVKATKDGEWGPRRRDEESVDMAETPSSSRLFLLFLSLFLVLGTVWALPDALYASDGVTRRAQLADDEPRGPWEGVSPDVQYDNYTLILKGQRVFLQYVAILNICDPFAQRFGIAQESSTRSASLFLRYGLISCKRPRQLDSTRSVSTSIWDSVILLLVWLTLIASVP